MRVLIDECLNWRLGRALTGHFCSSVQRMGWNGIRNGELLARMEQERIDVFITGDRNLQFQQHLPAASVAVVVLAARSVRGWQQLGILRADGGQVREGIKACQRALQMDPRNALSHAMLADIYRLNSQWPEALREAGTAQKLDPNLARAYQVTGRVYAEQKEYRKAAKAFSKVIQLNPGWPNSLVARGDAYLDGGEYKSALADYREAVRRFPRSNRAHAGLAQFLATCPAAEWRNGKEALVEAKIACVQTDWKDPYAVAALGNALAETGNFPEAIQHAKRALEMSQPRDREEAQKQLDAYRKGKPWREQP